MSNKETACKIDSLLIGGILTRVFLASVSLITTLQSLSLDPEKFDT